MKRKMIDATFRNAGAALLNRRRLITLVRKFGQKILTLDNPKEEIRQLLHNWRTATRMLQAYLHGKYRHVSTKSLVALVAGVVYFLNPLDAIPDLIPFTGFVDDFSFMWWVYHSIENEIQKYRAWEQLQTHS